MPKIIDEARKKILQCAKRKMLDEGYNALSLRSVAKECGIAVGTIYNYFDNKDDLISAIMQEDWDITFSQMHENCSKASHIREGMDEIYQSIDSFCKIYKDIWHQYSSTGRTCHTANKRHTVLLKQVGECIILLLERFNYEQDIEIAPLLAEMFLSSVMQSEITLHQIDLVVERLFQ